MNNALWQEVAPARTGGQIAESLYVFDRQDLVSRHWRRRENPVFSGWGGGSRHSRGTSTKLADGSKTLYNAL
ncbi:hypothetical protein FUA83_23010 [Salmonella enterica]|nr:hypothetical protein [Salmonella enterica]HCU3780000.1 hypothetical protein [Escherichia coli]